MHNSVTDIRDRFSVCHTLLSLGILPPLMPTPDIVFREMLPPELTRTGCRKSSLSCYSVNLGFLKKEVLMRNQKKAKHTHTHIHFNKTNGQYQVFFFFSETGVA